jgi:FkbM family methyltransferase
MINNYKALNGLDRKMEKYINYRDGYFIEIGGNDGISQSNTYFYEKSLGWNGILIEPSEKFEKLRLNRDVPGNHLYNDACCSFSDKGKNIEFIYSNLMTIAENIKGDIDDIDKFIESSRQHMGGQDNYKFIKKGRPLSDILDESSAPTDIDFFSLDTEGMEGEVLKGIDFSTYSFKFILVECRDIDKLTNVLSTHNYSCIDKISHHDYVFSKNT